MGIRKSKGNDDNKSSVGDKVKDGVALGAAAVTIAGAAVAEGVQRLVTGRDPNQPQPPATHS